MEDHRQQYVCYRIGSEKLVQRCCLFLNEKVRDTKPHEMQEHPMHSEKATVEYEFCAGHSIGRYFFEGDIGQVILVNGVPYRCMISKFFWCELDNRPDYP